MKRKKKKKGGEMASDAPAAVKKVHPSKKLVP
jgi:hypothetical protein